MSDLSFKVTAEEAGVRVDKYIAVKLGDDYSRTFARELVSGGYAKVNGDIVKPSYAVSDSDVISIEMPPPSESAIEPEDIPLDILYEDDAVIVVNKKAGMVVHPGAGNLSGTLVNALLYHAGTLADTGDGARPGIVHRLDKDTSGVIVAAKTDRAMRSLGKQFLNRTVKKTYIAIVKGHVESDNAIIEEPLARDLNDRKKMTIDHDRGKPSCSVYHVLKRFQGFTVLRVELHTGRTHQIRVHMKYAGHPVLGDVAYGRKDDMPRQALHAEKIGFHHPDTGEYMEFSAPVPEDMLKKIKNGKAL